MTTSEYASIYLGTLGEDPTPLFLDTHPEAFEGAPVEAKMLVRFRQEDFPHLGRDTDGRFPRDEYFGEDGWPVDFPAHQRDLSADVRRYVQTGPSTWRSWDASRWTRARRNQLSFRTIYEQSARRALPTASPVLGPPAKRAPVASAPEVSTEAEPTEGHRRDRPRRDLFTSLEDVLARPDACYEPGATRQPV